MKSPKKILQEKSLKKAKKRNNRKREIKNLEDIKSAGILFERDSDSTAANMQKLARFLHEQNIKVDVLAFVDIKKPTPEFSEKKSLELFYKKDLNWYKKPNNEMVTNFINKRFDLLIKADFSEQYPLKYICTASKSALVAGPDDGLKQVYDFIIEGHQKDVNNYHQQLIHYLSVINQKTHLNKPNYAE